MATSVILIVSMISSAAYNKTTLFERPISRSLQPVGTIHLGKHMCMLYLEGQPDQSRQAIHVRFKGKTVPNVQNVKFSYENGGSFIKVSARAYAKQLTGFLPVSENEAFDFSRFSIQAISGYDQSSIESSEPQLLSLPTIKIPLRKSVPVTTLIGIGAFCFVLFVPTLIWLIALRF